MQLLKQIFLLATSAFLLSVNTFSQNLAEAEKNLKVLGQVILRGATEEEKTKANSQFIEQLEEALSSPSSYSFPFDSLVTIARLTAPDNTFRIFNWHVPKEDGSYEYYGFIQLNPANQKKGKKAQKLLYKLQNAKEAKSAEQKILGPNEWFGAHYYKIVKPKAKNDPNYVLLGWDGNNPYSNKKLIDVLHFSASGEPKFGAPVFKMENNKLQKRVIFEYAKDATMSLRFNEEDKIIFDHLVPPNPQLQGVYSYYGPDFSYDALEYKKGTWSFLPNVDARNGKASDKKWLNPKR
jgi:hypothetical protein